MIEEIVNVSIDQVLFSDTIWNAISARETYWMVKSWDRPDPIHSTENELCFRDLPCGPYPVE